MKVFVITKTFDVFYKTFRYIEKFFFLKFRKMLCAAVQLAKGACGADGSWHHLHFFYAERQSDGSNLYIRPNLTD